MMELDGKPVTVDQLATLALVPYGHFTSIRVDDHKVRGLPLHMKRLARDCQSLYGVDLDVDKVRAYVRQVISEISKSIVVRVTIYDPSLELGRPGVSADPHILVTARPASALPLPPLRIQTAPYTRENPAVKHVGLFGTVYHRRMAQRNGFDDVLFVNNDGNVSEGATWNIGLFDGESVIWPQADILEGVTMRLLADAHRETTTAPVHLRDVPNMVAAFATNTVIGVRPISVIDNTELAIDLPVIKTLQHEYNGIEPEDV